MTTELATPHPYAHWMLREIHEQPDTLRATLQRYVEGDAFREEAIAPLRAWLRTQTHLVFAASGSSRHASLFAEVRIEETSPIAVDVEYASETIYSAAMTHQRAGVMVVSQSGETADTLAALREANAAGRPTLAITNVAGSSMDREAGVSLVTAAGRERAIPATKSFTAQLLLLELVAVLAGETHGTMSGDEVAARLRALAALPAAIAAQLQGWQASAQHMATALGDAASVLFVGRSLHYAMAREGALKLKESAYLPAEGYPSGELKHGPNALVGKDAPLVMLATREPGNAASELRYSRVLQLMREMRAQGATILAIANEGDADVVAAATATITVLPAAEALMAIGEVIPLQMLSYFVAVHRGVDVDAPRNLVKAVVTE